MNLIFSELNNHHDKSGFDCGVPPLNEYIKKYASQNQKKNIGLPVVVTEAGVTDKVIGYCTLSAAEIHFQSLPPANQRGVPKYPLPAVRIGRLAVDQSVQGKGVGAGLLMNALQRSLDASKVLAIYAVIVDAKDEKAKSFYKKYGFIEFQDIENSLFIPIATIAKT